MTGEAAVTKLKEELRKRGIVMQVGGCGCCGSPWLKVEIDGEVILDDDKIYIDMFEEAEVKDD